MRTACGPLVGVSRDRSEVRRADRLLAGCGRPVPVIRGDSAGRCGRRCGQAQRLPARFEGHDQAVFVRSIVAVDAFPLAEAKLFVQSDCRDILRIHRQQDC